MATKTEVKGKPTVIKNFEYHRNGVSGRGFYAFVVDMQFRCWDESLEEPATYLVTWFPPEGFGSKVEKEREELYPGKHRSQWDPGTDVAFIHLTPMGPDTSNTMRGDRLISHIAKELVTAYRKKYDSCL